MLDQKETFQSQVSKISKLAWNDVDGNRWIYRSFLLLFQIPSQAALTLTDAVKGAVQLGAHVCICA